MSDHLNSAHSVHQWLSAKIQAHIQSCRHESLNNGWQMFTETECWFNCQDLVSSDFHLEEQHYCIVTEVVNPEKSHYFEIQFLRLKYETNNFEITHYYTFVVIYKHISSFLSGKKNHPCNIIISLPPQWFQATSCHWSKNTKYKLFMALWKRQSGSLLLLFQSPCQKMCSLWSGKPSSEWWLILQYPAMRWFILFHSNSLILFFNLESCLWITVKFFITEAMCRGLWNWGFQWCRKFIRLYRLREGCDHYSTELWSTNYRNLLWAISELMIIVKA